MSDISDLVDPTGAPLQKPEPKEVVKEVIKEVEVNLDYKEQYLRALADYKNLQRKVDEERKSLFEIATIGVLEQLIPTLDLLHQAEIFIKDPGLKMVIAQFEKTIEDMGLTELKLDGTEYDPHTAEVVDMIEESGKENIVKEVVKRGYKVHERVVRIAQVKVTKKPEKVESKN